MFLLRSLIIHVGLKIVPGAEKIFAKTLRYLGLIGRVSEEVLKTLWSGHFKVTNYVNNNFGENRL